MSFLTLGATYQEDVIADPDGLTGGRVSDPDTSGLGGKRCNDAQKRSRIRHLEQDFGGLGVGWAGRSPAISRDVGLRCAQPSLRLTAELPAGRVTMDQLCFSSRR